MANLEGYAHKLLKQEIPKDDPSLSDTEVDPSCETKLIQEAKSCLWSAIRYIDEIEKSQTNIKEICKKLIKTTKEILPKNKQMICKITKINEPIEETRKFDNSKMGNNATTQSELSCKALTECNKKLYTTHKRKMQDADQTTLSNKGVNGGLEFDLYGNNENKGSMKTKNEKQIIGLNKPRMRVLKSALNENVWDFSWLILACSKPEDSLLILSEGFNSDERDKLLEKFLLAKTVWACGKCPNLSIDSMLSGYIECSVCCEWFHRACCSPEVLKETVFEDQFICDKCNKFSNEQLTQNNVFTDVVSYIVTDVQY